MSVGFVEARARAHADLQLGEVAVDGLAQVLCHVVGLSFLDFEGGEASVNLRLGRRQASIDAFEGSGQHINFGS
jgi:hypothetical protein